MTKYKSYGEKVIAEMLAKHDINFEYEHPTLIRQKYKDDDKERLSIWYPDFWLPKYSIIIEYFGMEGNKEYDRGKDRKLGTNRYYKALKRLS